MDKERLLRYLNQKYMSKCEIACNLPLGMNADEVWNTILEERFSKRTNLPLRNIHGDCYWYVLTDKMIAASEKIVEELIEQPTEQEFNSVSTIEEVFFTSYMEGAQISIQDAMAFLQSGEDAQDVEELMLLNNRQAGNFAASNIYHAIDEDYLHTLAYILTNGLDNGGGNYRLTDSIEIPSMRGESFEVPRSADISCLVSEFTDFLSDPKIHPLIKSAVSQAWILIVRPFPEGNERLARILSEIILIRAGYSFFSSVSLSAIIARNGYGYFNAIANILRTENGGDLTYFIEYFLTLLSSAIDELRTQKTEKEQEVYEAEKQMAQVSLKPAPEEKTVNHKVGKYAETVKRAVNELKREGRTQINTTDIMSITGLNNRNVYRELERLRKKGFLIKLESLKTGNIYGFRDSETMIPEDNYSPEVLNLLHELKTSSRCPKDRRLSEIITECLPRGIITKADYIRHNQESKWASDIKFAVMLGLAENIGKDKYRILTELADFRSNLMETQKSTLSALYEFFSDDMFSVEMAVAKLDYSSSHVSYILHQFKWLKLVDTQVNDDNSYSYQLKVNPKDDPELFSAA